jgi:hypothetical protein
MADAFPEVHRLSRFLFSREINNDIFSFLIACSDLVMLIRFPDTLYADVIASLKMHRKIMSYFRDLENTAANRILGNCDER